MRLVPSSSWNHSIWVIRLFDSECIHPNYPEDGIPRQKRRKVSPPQAHIGDKEDTPMLAAEECQPDQQAVVPIDVGDMIDFNYDMDGLMCSELSKFAF